MEYILFITGVILGSLITQIIKEYKTGHGRFQIERVLDSEEPGIYVVNISIPTKQALHKMRRIILKREHSQK